MRQHTGAPVQPLAPTATATATHTTRVSVADGWAAVVGGARARRWREREEARSLSPPDNRNTNTPINSPSPSRLPATDCHFLKHVTCTYCCVPGWEREKRGVGFCVWLPRARPEGAMQAGERRGGRFAPSAPRRPSLPLHATTHTHTHTPLYPTSALARRHQLAGAAVQADAAKQARRRRRGGRPVDRVEHVDQGGVHGWFDVWCGCARRE